jgi:hypothetical protein
VVGAIVWHPLGWATHDASLVLSYRSRISSK